MMNPEQKAAYIMAQSACALIEAMGMAAENQQRAAVGASPAYVEDAFLALIEKYGIHHNGTVGFLND